jgi:hypothetical protein
MVDRERATDPSPLAEAITREPTTLKKLTSQKLHIFSLWEWWLEHFLLLVICDNILQYARV